MARRYYKCKKGHISEFMDALAVDSSDAKAIECLSPGCTEMIGKDLEILVGTISTTKDNIYYKTGSRVGKKKLVREVTTADIRAQNAKKSRGTNLAFQRGMLTNAGGGRPDATSLAGMMTNNNAKVQTGKTKSGATFCLCWYGLQSTSPSTQQDILEITNPHWSSSRTDADALEDHFDKCYDAIKNAHSNQASTEVVGEAAAAIYMMSRSSPTYVLRRGIVKGTGIDQIWQCSTSNEYIIVEAKGPGAAITSDFRYFNQMSRDWVVHNLARMTNSATKAEKDLANEIITNCGIGFKTYGPGKYQIGVTATSDPDYNSYTIYKYDAGTSTTGTHKLYGWVISAGWSDAGLKGTKQAMPGGNPYF